MLCTHHRNTCSSRDHAAPAVLPARNRATPALFRPICRPVHPRQRSRARACLSFTGDAAYTGNRGLQNSHAAGELQVGVRPATVNDYWAIAEVHAQSFYPKANWIFAPLLRIDRVFALQMGTDNELRGRQGRFKCFVAYDLNTASRAGTANQSRGSPGADVPHFFRFLLAEPLRAGFEVSPDRIGLLGAVVVDMQGSYLPAERVEKGPFVAYERPQDAAYISNLAVVPRARRQGIGEELLLAAEKAAADWGCKRLALHCDASNEAASGLYTKHNYTTISKEGPWMSFLSGRQVRLKLMARELC